MKVRFSSHALAEIEKRQLPLFLVETVLENPQQILQQDEEIAIYQSQLDFGAGKPYLLRVFINITVDPTIVVTIYRTSKIAKYWRNS
ncbi:DUF4258 domain-containing protein [bacterium]|nr:DUF4258 domain-containing protein [bacterium]